MPQLEPNDSITTSSGSATAPPLWWRELFRKEVIAGHLVNYLVALGASFILGLIVTISLVTVAAWRQSIIWTQRAVGATMAFGLAIIMTAVALYLLRRRLITPEPARPVAGKGYLDHRADRAKAQSVIVARLNQITAIKVAETEAVRAHTEWLRNLYKRPDDEKRLAMELSDARREARARDRITRKMGREVSGLAKAIESCNAAELGYWRWYTVGRSIDKNFARSIIKLTEDHRAAIENNVAVEGQSRAVLSDSMGRSQVLNEAITRRLVVMERQAAAVASQIEPLREVIRLLTPFAEADSSEPSTAAAAPAGHPSSTSSA